jgi:subtilisin-like proprotein convertase family protein
MTLGFLRSRTRLALFLTTALVALGATAGTASAATGSFSNPAPITITDDSIASPYPSTINVNGFAGNVQKATVTLNGFTHTYPDDIAVLLVGPSGANSILMGRVGGSSDTGVISLTFDQSSPNTLNEDDTATGGTYRPSQGPTIPDPLSPPAPGGPYPVDLNALNTSPANGTWKLFIEDQVSGDEGAVLGGWTLGLTAPVNTLAAGKPKLNKKKGTAQVPVTVGDAGRLKVSGKGVKGKAKNTAGPGTVKLTLGAKGAAKQTLSSTGHVAVKAKITFTPNGGAAKTVKKKIKLKKTL